MLFGKIYEDRAGRAHKKTLTASSLALISNERIATMFMNPYRRVHVKAYVKFIVQSPGGPLKCRKIHKM